MDVTPVIASKFLAKNTHNRRAKFQVINRYMRDMQAGDWRYDGTPIRFTGLFDPESDVSEWPSDAYLIDGQHRLQAIVKSGVTIRLLVATGLDGRVQETIDVGAKRTINDALTLMGKKNVGALASALRSHWALKTENLRTNYGASVPELLEWFENNPALEESLLVAKRFSDIFGSTFAGMVAAIDYEMSSIDQEEATEFWEALRNGVYSDGRALEEGNPILVLRRQLLTKPFKGKGQEEKKKFYVWIAKTWNSWRKGEYVQRVVWRSGGSHPEPIPDLI